MSITIDPTVPPNTESPTNGAQRIRNIAAAILGLIGLPTGSAQTVGGPFISSFDVTGAATFVTGTQVVSDPTTTTGIATKQYVDGKTPYVVATGGDAYVGTFPDVALVTGQQVVVKFPAANTGTFPTFNLNSSGATSIVMVDGANPAIGSIKLNGTYLMTFDGASATWVLDNTLNPAASTFPLTTDVSAATHKITNLGNATVTGDAINLGQFTGVNNAKGSITLPILVGGVLVNITVNWGASAPATVNANSNSGALAQTFATNFATSCYSVIAVATNVGGAGANGCTVSVDNSSITTSGFNLWIANQTSTNRSMGSQWLAVGQ